MCENRPLRGPFLAHNSYSAPAGAPEVPTGAVLPPALALAPAGAPAAPRPSRTAYNSCAAFVHNGGRTHEEET